MAGALGVSRVGALGGGWGWPYRLTAGIPANLDSDSWDDSPRGG